MKTSKNSTRHAARNLLNAPNGHYALDSLEEFTAGAKKYLKAATKLSDGTIDSADYEELLADFRSAAGWKPKGEGGLFRNTGGLSAMVPQWRTLRGVKAPFYVWCSVESGGVFPASDRKAPTGEPVRIVRTEVWGGIRYGWTEDARQVKFWGVATKLWVAAEPDVDTARANLALAEADFGGTPEPVPPSLGEEPHGSAHAIADKVCAVPIVERKPVPENFRYMAEHGDTVAARAFWTAYCEKLALAA